MTLGLVAGFFGAELHGPADLEISGPVDVDSFEPGGIAFAESEAFLAKAEASQAAALILPRHLRSEVKPYIVVDNPRICFRALLEREDRSLPLPRIVHPTAVISTSAKVDPTASIGAYVVIEGGAVVGAGCRVYPFTYVGEECVLEERCTLYPHVVLHKKVRLGAGTTVHAGAVLGADGFGYTWDGSRHVKEPHIGRIDIGQEAEIGALTAIDRAKMGVTRIGSGTKIDNLVQVAHNVQIGENCAIAAQVGIAGSARIGDGVLMAGQSGVADHTDVASGAVIGARAAVLQDVEEPGLHLGTPARPARESKRAMLLLTKLPELLERIRKLEKRLDGRE